MKKNKIITIMVVPALLISIAACTSEETGDKNIIKEKPGETITVIDDAAKKAGEPDVSVETIDRYENMEISGWVDEETVLVSKENESLDKMELEELSDSYPRSLYLYNLTTKEYELLKERENLHLGGAQLSPDKKHLIYQEYSLGDPVYHVMNLNSLDTFRISGEPIGGAISATWADHETIIGAAYSGGAYTASTAGKIALFEEVNKEVNDDALFLIEQMNDTIYYNTNSDSNLMALDLASSKKTSLNLNDVYGVYPSPDRKQMLILQSSGSKTTMILCDANGDNRKTITEGTELGGVSWSPDQRMIAYRLKGDVNGTTVKGLYLYDMLSDETTQLAVDIENAETSWSPSGKELVYTEWNGKQSKSSIVYLKYSLQK